MLLKDLYRVTHFSWRSFIGKFVLCLIIIIYLSAFIYIRASKADFIGVTNEIGPIKSAEIVNYAQSELNDNRVVSDKKAITNDDVGAPNGDGIITSARIVRDIRFKMNDTTIVSVPIQAYIIPHVDAHQSEYVAARDNRVQFVSGFTGSAATIVIGESIALLWTDSRYHSQAEAQLDSETWTLMKSGLPGVPTMEEWLVNKLPPNSLIGIDPFLVKASGFLALSERLQASGHKRLVPIQSNLVDLVWKTRPELKLKDLEIVERRFSGKKASEKVGDVRRAMKNLNAQSHILSTLDDIAWLLNLRGSDIESTPVFFAYVILTQTELYLHLYGEQRFNVKIDNHFYMEGIDVLVRDYNSTLVGISNVIRATSGNVLLSLSVSEAIQSVVPVERRVNDESPILGMKVIKNDIEARGMQEAHIRDGAALVKYLHWLETEIDDQHITEMKGAEKLKEFRLQQENYRGQSFPTISAVGSNAAIIHYKPTPETDRQITRNEIYLIDAGAQYLDGTTDISRTVHFGTPTHKEIDAFTRVLKGFISVATAIFPNGAPYSFFDAMARRSLWDVGLDYEHATGHGVGAYLNVHETPPLISSENSPPGMMRNMFTSNEPGYYETDDFGIRIENVIQVIEAPNSSNYFGGYGACKFNDVTMVPIQKKMISIDLLTDAEIKWLNHYHERIREKVTPLLGNNSNIVDWLYNQTQPISRNGMNNSNDTPATAT